MDPNQIPLPAENPMGINGFSPQPQQPATVPVLQEENSNPQTQFNGISFQNISLAKKTFLSYWKKKKMLSKNKVNNLEWILYNAM